MTCPFATSTATALNAGLTVRFGQKTPSTISSGGIQAPTADRFGPTSPPCLPTLWQDRHADVAARKATAPRRASPCAFASASSSFTSGGIGDFAAGVELQLKR